MAEISTQMVKELREATGAGVLDCKKALSETNGDFDAAVEALRKKGLSAAAKKSGRETNEGLIGHYVHPGDKVASLVEVNCETDFVARTDEFQQLSRDLAMQVVASQPKYVSREHVPEETVAEERKIYREQTLESGKPEHIVDQIVEGRLEKWYSEICLLEQPYIKDPNVTVQELLTSSIASLGENIRVNRFARLEVGD